MTPNFKSLRQSMDKLRSYLDDESAKVQARVEDIAKNAAPSGFRMAHAALDSVKGELKDIEDFVSGLNQSNSGAVPLDESSAASGPRSSEVADKS